jgi:hypothetical protein
MRPWSTYALSPSTVRETNSNLFQPIHWLKAWEIPDPAPGLTIFAEADPAYDHDLQPRRRGQPRKNTKLTGELGEAAFLHTAIQRGLCVARPWGDSRRYDFIVQSSPCSNTFHRIQVKCTESLNARGFQVQATYCDRKRKGKYTPADIDFLIAYIIPLHLFYIVPIAACPKSASLRFYPQGSQRNQAKLEHYREAWHLLTM